MKSRVCKDTSRHAGCIEEREGVRFQRKVRNVVLIEGQFQK